MLIGSEPLADVNIAFTGGIASVQTDGTGFYTQNVPYLWDGTVTPSKTGYSFAPTSTIYTDVAADQTGQDYAATSLSALTVTSPNGNESWAPGTTHAITWTQNYLSGNVTIALYKSGRAEKHDRHRGCHRPARSTGRSRRARPWAANTRSGSTRGRWRIIRTRTSSSPGRRRISTGTD